jgi:hypothetical protein
MIFTTPPRCEVLANIKKGGAFLRTAFLNIRSASIYSTLTLYMTDRQ